MERIERHEVHEQTVDDTVEDGTRVPVTRETHTVQTQETVPATTAVPVAPSGVTNVNVSKPAAEVDPDTGAVVTSGGNVSINTPDGTQVNVNS